MRNLSSGPSERQSLLLFRARKLQNNEDEVDKWQKKIIS